MAFKTLSATVDDQSVGRIDLIVRDQTELSRSQARGMIDQGCVSINGVQCNSAAKEVVLGDVVNICFDPHTRYKEKKRRWDDRTFTIAHEDDFLIVVNKAAGTLSVPTEKEDRNTLVDRVSVYLNHSRRNKSAWVVHRLDRDISGLLVFGKQEAIGTSLVSQFKERKHKHIYTAIVAGIIADEQGSFDSHLTTGNNLAVYNGPESPKSEQAVTDYKVLRRNADTTLVEITLQTAVRNQIRVQFADAGHPILGDPRYASEQAQHPRWIRKRIALHARALEFVHPITEQTMKCESELPSAIEKFMHGCKSESSKKEPAVANVWEQAKRKRTSKRNETS